MEQSQLQAIASAANGVKVAAPTTGFGLVMWMNDNATTIFLVCAMIGAVGTLVSLSRMFWLMYKGKGQ